MTFTRSQISEQSANAIVVTPLPSALSPTMRLLPIMLITALACVAHGAKSATGDGSGEEQRRDAEGKVLYSYSSRGRSRPSRQAKEDL